MVKQSTINMVVILAFRVLGSVELLLFFTAGVGKWMNGWESVLGSHTLRKKLFNLKGLMTLFI